MSHEIHEAIATRVLLDPTTGLPSVPYFKLIQEWERRRSSRYGHVVRVLRLDVLGSTPETRRILPFRLCRELRDSDLIASRGAGHYRLLLLSPDAEQAARVASRLDALAKDVSWQHQEEVPLEFRVMVEDVVPDANGGECNPCERPSVEDSGEHPPIE